MKTAIRKIFNKHCTQVNMDYNEYIVLKPDEFIKEFAELFASQNPERVIAFANYFHKEKELMRRTGQMSNGSIMNPQELYQKFFSDLCSGSQEKEQAKNECEHNNTEIQDLRCNVCLDCGKIIEMID